jgi:DnaJ-class molecular chaperone
MTRKAWNGGSIERAMELARERQRKLIAQGATLCGECQGEGGSVANGVCIECRGAGVIVPPEGLTPVNASADYPANETPHALARRSPV